MKSLTCLLAAIILFTCSVGAHSGRTDSQGGHHVGGTNEYHYHHGYPAHQHTDGVCPYDFDDKTGESSGTSSGSLKKTEAKEEAKEEAKKEKSSSDIIVLGIVIAVYVIFFLLVMSK